MLIVCDPSVYDTTEQLLLPAATIAPSVPVKQLALEYVWYITLPNSQIGAMLYIAPCSIAIHPGARVIVTSMMSLDVALQLLSRIRESTIHVERPSDKEDPKNNI